MKETPTYASFYKEGIKAGSAVAESAGKTVWKDFTRKGTFYQNEGVGRRWGRRLLWYSPLGKNAFVRQVIYELDHNDEELRRSPHA